MAQIIFEYTTQYGVFRDALNLPDNHGLSDAEIDALKYQRLNNWLAAVTPVETPTEEV